MALIANQHSKRAKLYRQTHALVQYNLFLNTAQMKGSEELNQSKSVRERSISAVSVYAAAREKFSI